MDILVSQRVREQAGKERLSRTSKLNTAENCLTRIVLLFLLKLAFKSFHWSALFF